MSAKFKAPPKPERNKTRVAVAVPAQDQVAAGFAYDLARMMAVTASNRSDIELSLFMHQGTLLPEQRTGLVMEAVARECSHILFLDSDMRFPGDTLIQLLERKQPIVAANYSKRRMPFDPVAAVRQDEGVWVPLYTEESSHGLEEVVWVGMGVMLIEVAVFKALERPWFALWWKDAAAKFDGEDVFFCHHARHAGYKILIDHDLSKRVAHIGTFEYKLEHTLINRPEREPAVGAIQLL